MAVTQLFSALVSLFALTAATVPDPITVGGGSGVYDNNYCVGSYGFGGPTVAWTQFGRIKVDIMYDATHWTLCESSVAAVNSSNPNDICKTRQCGTGAVLNVPSKYSLRFAEANSIGSYRLSKGVKASISTSVGWGEVYGDFEDERANEKVVYEPVTFTGTQEDAEPDWEMFNVTDRKLNGKLATRCEERRFDGETTLYFNTTWTIDGSGATGDWSGALAKGYWLRDTFYLDVEECA